MNHVNLDTEGSKTKLGEITERSRVLHISDQKDPITSISDYNTFQKAKLNIPPKLNFSTLNKNSLTTTLIQSADHRLEDKFGSKKTSYRE